MGELDGNTVNVSGWASGGRTPVNGDIAMIGSDKDLIPFFYAGTRINQFKSIQAGAPVYDPVDMLKVYHPGEPLNVPERPVNDLDKRRFRAQWEAYKEGKSQKTEGTPLSVLFPHQPEVIKTLEAIHISTVQQLAGISDTGTQNMMFGFNLREKAQKYLETSEKGVAFHQMEKALADRDAQIRDLNEKVSALAAAAVAPKSEPAPSSELASLQQTVAALAATVAASAAKPKQGWPKGKPRKQPQQPAPAPQSE